MFVVIIKAEDDWGTIAQKPESANEQIHALAFKETGPPLLLTIQELTVDTLQAIAALVVHPQAVQSCHAKLQGLKVAVEGVFVHPGKGDRPTKQQAHHVLGPLIPVQDGSNWIGIAAAFSMGGDDEFKVEALNRRFQGVAVENLHDKLRRAYRRLRAWGEVGPLVEQCVRIQGLLSGELSVNVIKDFTDAFSAWLNDSNTIVLLEELRLEKDSLIQASTDLKAAGAKQRLHEFLSAAHAFVKKFSMAE